MISREAPGAIHTLGHLAPRLAPFAKRTAQNSVPAKFEPWLRLRQFKLARAVLVQQYAEREAIQGFAVLHRCKRVRAVLQKRPQRALHALINSNRSAPFVDSSARNASSVQFANLELHHLP